MNKQELMNCAICIVIGFLLYSFIQNGFCGKKDLIEGYVKNCDDPDVADTCSETKVNQNEKCWEWRHGGHKYNGEGIHGSCDPYALFVNFDCNGWLGTSKSCMTSPGPCQGKCVLKRDIPEECYVNDFCDPVHK